jgi:hypothetical protein
MPFPFAKKSDPLGFSDHREFLFYDIKEGI